MKKRSKNSIDRTCSCLSISNEKRKYIGGGKSNTSHEVRHSIHKCSTNDVEKKVKNHRFNHSRACNTDLRIIIIMISSNSMTIWWIGSSARYLDMSWADRCPRARRRTEMNWYQDLYLHHRWYDLVCTIDDYRWTDWWHRLSPRLVSDDQVYREVLQVKQSVAFFESDENTFLRTIFRWDDQIKQGLCATLVQFDLFLCKVRPDIAYHLA